MKNFLKSSLEVKWTIYLYKIKFCTKSISKSFSVIFISNEDNISSYKRQLSHTSFLLQCKCILLCKSTYFYNWLFYGYTKDQGTLRTILRTINYHNDVPCHSSDNLKFVKVSYIETDFHEPFLPFGSPGIHSKSLFIL